jgi:signal transduction histidine kinase
MENTVIGRVEGGSASRPRVQALKNSESLARETTRYMVGNLEWAAPIFQGVCLFVSGVYDPYAGEGRVIILCLAAAHLVLVPFYIRGFGPVTRGGWWVLLYIAQCLLVNGLQGALSQPRTYGDHLSCVPGCTYSGTVWLLLAFYPWLPMGLVYFRRLFEWTLLGIYYGYFVFLAWLNNGNVSFLNVRTAGLSVLWLIVAYIFGEAIGRMCLAAARKQLEVQQRNYNEFFDFLHSHVKSSIAAIRIDLHDPLRAREKLNELEDTISSYRIELLLAQEQAPLAALFSERIRTFTDVLNIAATPRLGALTVTRPVGMLVARALGDLLKNAAKYGATSVEIGCDPSGGELRMEVTDNGPGFVAEILEDSGRSLHRLRRAARLLGGDLTMRPPDNGTGAVLTLTVPLHGPEAGR